MMLTVREAAVLLGKPARTVRAMLARGELRGVRRATGWTGRGMPRVASCVGGVAAG